MLAQLRYRQWDGNESSFHCGEEADDVFEALRSQNRDAITSVSVWCNLRGKRLHPLVGLRPGQGFGESSRVELEVDEREGRRIRLLVKPARRSKAGRDSSVVCMTTTFRQLLCCASPDWVTGPSATVRALEAQTERLTPCCLVFRAHQGTRTRICWNPHNQETSLVLLTIASTVFSPCYRWLTLHAPDLKCSTIVATPILASCVGNETDAARSRPRLGPGGHRGRSYLFSGQKSPITRVETVIES